MSYAGIRTYFNLESGAGTPVPTDISHWLDGVTPGSDTDELDGTTFQPGVAKPIKEIIPGFTTRSMSLSVKWVEDAEVFFSEAEGAAGLAYVYGPLGSDEDMTGVGGDCNCLSWTGPVSTVDGVITGTVELRATSRAVGTFGPADAFTPLAAVMVARRREQSVTESSEGNSRIAELEAEIRRLKMADNLKKGAAMRRKR
jgi:hypothetical protein